MIIREDMGSIAVVRMAYGKVSALDTAFCTALIDEINGIAAGTFRALVLTGTGTTFSAGVDLLQALKGGAQYLESFLPSMGRLFRAVLVFPKPAVAAVNGHAIAGGCIMAAACDHRVMSNGGGRIGIPELLVGVPFPTLPFEIVRGRVNPTAFRQLVYTGRTLSASDAERVGLVDGAVESAQLLPRAIEVAEQLAEIPAQTFALTKRTFTTPILDRVNASSQHDAEVIAAWQSPQVLARMQRYVESTLRK